MIWEWWGIETPHRVEGLVAIEGRGQGYVRGVFYLTASSCMAKYSGVVCGVHLCISDAPSIGE